jgi:hypothetical protein
MAKDKQAEVIQVPADDWQRLQERLTSLEYQQRLRDEQTPALHAKSVIDRRHEEFERNSMRSAQERTQEIADKNFGTDGPRWRCRLDSTTEDGRPGPDVSIFFPLDLCANSDLEAQARYQSVMGIRKHDYRIAAARVEAANAA